jgi:hypothetical protein
MRQYLFAILALGLICSSAFASEVIVVTPTETPILPTPVPTLIPYIGQGDTVYVGDYIDISGAAPPYTSLAYWDGYDMYDSPPKYNLSLPDGKRGYYKFYLDPEIFGQRLGRWYKYSGEYEKQGNNRIFTVMPPKLFNSTLTFPNGTSINLSELIQQNYTPLNLKPSPLLPEKRITDYVVAKGDELDLPSGDYRVWILGGKTGVYSNIGHNITKEQITALDGGNYDIVFQYPGNNTIYDASCDTPLCKNLIPGLYGKTPVNIEGKSPIVYDELKKMLVGTDDALVEYHLQVENPYITIHQADEIEYTTHSALNVRGYSNVANGTKITVSLDEKNAYYKDIPKIQMQTVAVRTAPGNLSYYSVNVPFNYDDLAADARNHTLTARTELGGIVQKDFKISLMPADSYRPNATLKYIEGRNPFVPTPTPEVVTKIETQIVTQIVTVQVTPSNETVYAQQKKAQDDVAANWVSLAVTILLAIAVLIGLGYYAMRVWRRL